MNFIERAINRLLGRVTIKVTKRVEHSEPIRKEKKEMLIKAIKENKHNTVNVGDHVCYAVGRADLIDPDPQRPEFNNCVVTGVKKKLFGTTLACIEQDKKCMWVMPQLLKKI